MVSVIPHVEFDLINKCDDYSETNTQTEATDSRKRSQNEQQGLDRRRTKLSVVHKAFAELSLWKGQGALGGFFTADSVLRKKPVGEYGWEAVYRSHHTMKKRARKNDELLLRFASTPRDGLKKYTYAKGDDDVFVRGAPQEALHWEPTTWLE